MRHQIGFEKAFKNHTERRLCDGFDMRTQQKVLQVHALTILGPWGGAGVKRAKMVILAVLNLHV